MFTPVRSVLTPVCGPSDAGAPGPAAEGHGGGEGPSEGGDHPDGGSAGRAAEAAGEGGTDTSLFMLLMGWHMAQEVELVGW